MLQRRYLLLAFLAFVTGCIVSPEQLTECFPQGPADAGQSVGQVAPPVISDPNDPALDSPAASQAPIRVRLSNPTPRDADCHVTMELIGREVHFSFRRVLAATESLVIGPDQADIVRIEATFLGQPPAAMEPQELRIGRDFAPGDIIDFVLVLPVGPPTIAIEGLDADVTVEAGELVAFDIVTQNAAEGTRIAAFADPDDDPDNGNEIAILEDAPAAERTSVAWDTTEVPPGTYAVYAELRDGDEVVRFGPAPGYVIVESAPPPEGACCFLDGTCEVLTAEACSLSGGEYQGDFTTCDPNPCLPPWGACCFPDGTCQEFTAEECVVAGGEYQGDFVPCDPNPCPPVGACCYPDGTCEIILEAQCLEGEWLGPGTTCDMCPCVVPCPPEARPEGEACGQTLNDGCLMEEPSFEPIVCGETVCGTAWFEVLDPNTYDPNNPEGLLYDTDWYELSFPEDTLFTVAVEAEFNVLVLLMDQFVPGVPGCENLTGDALDAISAPECVPAVISRCVPAGTYYVYVQALPDAGESLTCEDDNHYTIALACEPCEVPRGACCFPDYICEVWTADQCAGLGGDYQGDGVGCDPNPCLPQEGACCFPDDVCELMTEVDCIAGEGVYQGDLTTCEPNPCRDPGDTCDNPLTVDLPAALPYSNTNTTCGRGNDYVDTCLSPYDAGEDIIYELTVATTISIQITVDPKGIPDTGVALARDCPPAQCIEAASDPIGKPYSTDCYVLDPGTYYVMVDTKAPECIGSFALTIEQCE